jgi:hypothetical protein
MPYKVGEFDGGPGTRVKLSVDADEYDEQNYYLVNGSHKLLIHNARIPGC